MTSFYPRNILLTGATGVVGARLLCEILARTQCNVFCIIRDKDPISARKRLAQLAAVYDPQGTLVKEFATRVIPLVGDLSKKRFGLENSKYDRLVQTVNLVFNAAANVSMIASYKQLAEVNVKGVGEVIEFCLAGDIPLAHISSYSVMGNKAYHSDFVFKEHHFNVGQRFDYQYYEKSKWDGEKRIHQARRKGLQAVILRLGDVFGDSQTGCYTLTQTTNRSIYYEILKTIVDTGLFFFSTDPLFLTPVNYVAKSSLYLAFTPEAYGNTYHLANSQVNLMYEFVNHLIDFGYRVRIIPFRDYLIILKKQAIQKNGKPYLSSFNNLMVYSEQIVGLDRMVSSTIGRDTLVVDTTQALKMLAKPNIICPKIDSELMAKYLRYCIYKKYIPAPSHQTPLAKIIM